MQELIARLIRCGVPRITALFLCNHYLKQKKPKEFERYVEAVEEECRGCLEDV